MRSLTVRVPAKVNLLLHVEWPQRPDGYHNVATILQAVSLYDRLEVRLVRAKGLAFACDDPAVPRGKANLVVRAALEFLGQTGARGTGVEFHLTKQIPMAAGLGGGSADAAGALYGLRALLMPEMPDGLLESIGADLGSDVPFFLAGGTQVGISRGELLSVVEPSPCLGLPMVLVKPEGGCSTAEVYARYDRSREAPRVLASPGRALDALREGRFPEVLSNDLGPVAETVNPEVRRALAALRGAGLPSLVSGSGSTCFGVARSMDQAQGVASALGSAFPFTCAVEAVNHGCEVVRDYA
jgi:4-diphosphocytidyl-2-C-methyl-D-erythritol kinase